MHLVCAGLPGTKQPHQLDVPEAACLSREGAQTSGARWPLEGHVIHGPVEVGNHSHHGNPIRRRVHGAEHVHIGGHLGRNHAQCRRLAGQAEKSVRHRGHDLLRRDAVAADQVSVHLHAHVAVAHHPHALHHGVRAHHTEGRMAVGAHHLHRHAAMSVAAHGHLVAAARTFHSAGLRFLRNHCVG